MRISKAITFYVKATCYITSGIFYHKLYKCNTFQCTGGKMACLPRFHIIDALGENQYNAHAQHSFAANNDKKINWFDYTWHNQDANQPEISPK